MRTFVSISWEYLFLWEQLRAHTKWDVQRCVALRLTVSPEMVSIGFLLNPKFSDFQVAGASLSAYPSLLKKVLFRQDSSISAMFSGTWKFVKQRSVIGRRASGCASEDKRLVFFCTLLTLHFYLYIHSRCAFLFMSCHDTSCQQFFCLCNFIFMKLIFINKI